FLFNSDICSRDFMVQTNYEGKTAIIFGDGKRGARLPSGRENVNATYRSGIATEGEIGANQLTILKARPFGIRSVTNPMPATGAVAPEDMEGARIKAPFSVRALDRIVSLKDYEDFTRAYPGVAKTQVKVLETGEGRLIHLTIAAADGNQIQADSDYYR